MYDAPNTEPRNSGPSSQPTSARVSSAILDELGGQLRRTYEEIPKGGIPSSIWQALLKIERELDLPRTSGAFQKAAEGGSTLTSQTPFKPFRETGGEFGLTMARGARTATNAPGTTRTERLTIMPRALLTIGQRASYAIDLEGRPQSEVIAWYHEARNAFLDEWTKGDGDHSHQNERGAA